MNVSACFGNIFGGAIKRYIVNLSRLTKIFNERVDCRNLAKFL